MRPAALAASGHLRRAEVWWAPGWRRQRPAVLATHRVGPAASRHPQRAESLRLAAFPGAALRRAEVPRPFAASRALVWAAWQGPPVPWARELQRPAVSACARAASRLALASDEPAAQQQAEEAVSASDAGERPPAEAVGSVARVRLREVVASETDAPVRLQEAVSDVRELRPAAAAGVASAVPEREVAEAATARAAELRSAAARLGARERRAVVLRAAVGLQVWLRAVAPSAAPSAAASVFHRGQLRPAAAPARSRWVRFAHAMRSLRMASRSEPSWQAARSEVESCREIPGKVLEVSVAINRYALGRNVASQRTAARFISACKSLQNISVHCAFRRILQSPHL
jgi:hypothetical protein